jgi:phosphate-induced protein 1
MKMKKLLTLIAVCALAVTSVAAQNSRTTSKMLYHDGPVLTGTQNLYVIWYGCWNNNCGPLGDQNTRELMTWFLSSIGNTPYIQINSTYPDTTGQAPTGALIYGGDAFDATYSHGLELTQSDIAGIISDQVNNFLLPQDSRGIYVVIASADVASSAMGFCTTSSPSYHGQGIVNGSPVKYIFLGNPNRCPSVAGPQFSTIGPTPNGTYTGDVLVSNLAHGLNTILTDPLGNGWFDRYGLENADKCQNMFGQTYLTSNGARANIRLGARDYLIQQNWVNDRKARCAMFR